jgi:hypothetical protein
LYRAKKKSRLSKSTASGRTQAGYIATPRPAPVGRSPHMQHQESNPNMPFSKEQAALRAAIQNTKFKIQKDS